MDRPKVKAGKEIMKTRYSNDIVHISSPNDGQTDRKHAFFSLLDKIKKEESVKATTDEIREWIEEGRV